MKRKTLKTGVIISLIILAVLFAVRFIYSITYVSETTGYFTPGISGLANQNIN